MTTEEKFNAAVNVIRGLPKNGEMCKLLSYHTISSIYNQIVLFEFD